MNIKLKTLLPDKKTLLIISLLSLFSGVLSCIAGDILLPISIGLLSVLYLFDDNKYKPFAISVSIILLIINIVCVLQGITVSLFAPSSVILAIILCFGFSRRVTKSDIAYLMTVVCALFSLISCFLLAMMEQGEFTLDAVIVFYTELYDSFRTVFVENMMKLYTASGIQLTEEILVSLLDAQVDLITSYLLIGGFVTVGIAIKLFGFIVSRLIEEKKDILEWRFEASSIFAYAYVALSLISVFISFSDSVIAIPVLNLYNLFLVIFAYIGFNFATTILKMRMKTWLSILILIVLLVAFSSFTIQVLAMLGAMFTIRNNKFKVFKS